MTDDDQAAEQRAAALQKALDDAATRETARKLQKIQEDNERWQRDQDSGRNDR